ncbi:ClpXP protease specificity-enhancing factor SspB [Brevundimonas sp. GCM10030266]|uniref:ClpXP protease specificity-enhancing factor SspB n=1 Tax=Brevundimonas sp. GCM10030266 TaxID=3273386 RepID=UPI00360CB092
MRGLLSCLLVTACLLTASPTFAQADDGLQSLPAASSQRAILTLILRARPTPTALNEGEHYLITFKTSTDGVILPEKLRRRFPDRMTVILQHDFAVVTVTEETFTLALHFDDVPTSVTIPFSSVTDFTDAGAALHLFWDGSPVLPDLPQKS